MLTPEDQLVLLNALPGMAYRCSIEPPWKIEYMSPGARELCGIEPAKFVSGRIDWASIVHPDDLPDISLEVARAVSEDRQFTLTYRILDPTAGEKWVLEVGQAARDCSEAAVALVGFISDITAQKQMEQRLRESEAHYRAAVELNPQIPWIADPDGRILEVGPRWLEMLGADQTGRLGLGWERALHPADRDRITKAWNDSLASGRSYDTRYRLRLSDGSFQWVRSRASPRRDAAGHILKWYGTVEDINDQVELEQNLRHAEERYALAAYATGDIIWDWNLDDGTVRRVAAEHAMLGYPSDLFVESCSEWLLDLVHPDDYGRVRKGIQAVLSGQGHRWTDEYRLRKVDGSYAHMLDRGYLVPTDPGAARRMVGAMQDITETRRAAETVRQLEMRLAEVSRQTAMATIAATIAHELNQPLAATANWIAVSQHHLDKLNDPVRATIKDLLSRAEGQVLRAGEIIRRMRHIVSKGLAQRQRTSLRALIENVRAVIEASQLCSFDELTVDISDAADSIEADPVQIEQLLKNLIQNACRATPQGARTEIAIFASKGREGDAIVRVKDAGRGLPEGEELEQFSRFGQSSTGGLGVGLSICRTIVEAHGGTIWATNNDDRGASFWFTIPRQ